MLATDEGRMHDAFEAAPILEKLPLQIESIACYSEFKTVPLEQIIFQQKFTVDCANVLFIKTILDTKTYELCALGYLWSLSDGLTLFVDSWCSDITNTLVGISGETGSVAQISCFIE